MNDNTYYPVFLDLKDRLVVVVGGGSVAARKIDSLETAEARIRIIAPDISPAINLGANTQVINRTYTPGDIADASLVIAATNDEETNLAVSRDAGSLGIFCNVIDRPDLCSFIVPSVVDRGPIKIAISTGGASPALSKHLRMFIGRMIGDEYIKMAQLLGRIRPLVIESKSAQSSHKRVFDILINSDLLDALRENDRDSVDDILTLALGTTIDLEGIL